MPAWRPATRELQLYPENAGDWEMVLGNSYLSSHWSMYLWVVFDIAVLEVAALIGHGSSARSSNGHHSIQISYRFTGIVHSYSIYSPCNGYLEVGRDQIVGLTFQLVAQGWMRETRISSSMQFFLKLVYYHVQKPSRLKCTGKLDPCCWRKERRIHREQAQHEAEETLENHWTHCHGMI